MAAPRFEVMRASEIIGTRRARGGVPKRLSVPPLGFPAGVYMETPARVYKGRLRVEYDLGISLLGRLGLYASSWASASPSISLGESL